MFLLFTLLYLIKDKLSDLIERTFNRDGSPYLLPFHQTTETQKSLKHVMHGLVKKYVMRLPFCGQRFYWFDTKLYKQVAVIPMGTNCALLVADLFMFFMRETL